MSVFKTVGISVGYSQVKPVGPVGRPTWVAKSGRKAFSGKSNFPALAPPRNLRELAGKWKEA